MSFATPFTSVTPTAPPTDPPGLSTWEAIGLFVGVPLAVVLLIAGVVVLIERHSRRQVKTPNAPAAGVPRGIEPTAVSCVVMADSSGREIHHRADLLATGVVAPDTECWTARCTECSRPYQEDGQDVHFRTGRLALDAVEARDWRVNAGRLRCSTCP